MSADGGATWEDRSDEMMKYWVKDIVVDPHDPEQNTFLRRSMGWLEEYYG